MLSEYLLNRYPGSSPYREAVRDFVERICRRHMELRLADEDFEANLCAGDESRYWQRLSEALVGHELLEKGLRVRPSRKGPDFLVDHEGRNIWIEVICPEPSGLPTEWLNREIGKAVSFPHEAILLRWTSAIKEKAEKLLGSAQTNTGGYLRKGVVGANDPYVVAINGRLLRGASGFGSITGISQWPFAVEAVFALGPYAVQIDTQTLETVGSGHLSRFTITKPSGSQVRADTFFDPAFTHISAILAADIDECGVIGNAQPLALIHNPNAINPVPLGLLPSDDEYFATDRGNDYLIERQPGSRRA